MNCIKEDLLDDNKRYYIGLNEVKDITIGDLGMFCQKVSAYNQKKAKIFYKHDAITNKNLSVEDCTLMGFKMVFNQKDMKNDIEIRVE